MGGSEAKKPAKLKLQKELKAMTQAPPAFFPAVAVNERNILDWHFLLEGPPETPFEGGWFVGRLRFPPEYPFKPPSVMMVTPNGRFKENTRICMSMSDFHPETWNPMWSVSAILTGLLSFMIEDEITTGAVQTTDAEKRTLAERSVAHILSSAAQREMFPQLEQLVEAAKARKAAESAAGGGDGKGAVAQIKELAARAKAESEASTTGKLKAPEAGPPASASPEASPTGGRVSLDDCRLERLPEQAAEVATALVSEDADPGRAMEVLNTCASRYGQEHPLLLKPFALTLATAGQLEQAAQVCTGLVGAEVWEAQLRIAAKAKQEGNVAFKRGDYPGAEAAFRRGLTAEPRCAVLYCSLAACLMQRGDYAGAAEACEKSCERDSYSVKARARLAECQLNAGDHAVAHRTFAAVMAQQDAEDDKTAAAERALRAKLAKLFENADR